MAYVRTRRALPVACSMLLLGGLTACGGEARNGASGDSTAMASANGDSASAMMAGSTAMANSALDDTSVVHLISAVDRGEVAAGQMAVAKATHTDVKRYARMMVDEHTADLTTLRQMATTASITLDTTDATRADGTVPGVAGAQNASGAASTNGAVIQLQQNMQQVMSKLQVVSGADFDRQYIASQLAGHQQVLDLLKLNEPRFQNAQVQARVAAVSAAVSKHLERAREIQRTLGSDSTATTAAR